MNRILVVVVLLAAPLGCTPVQDVTVATCNRVHAEFSWWSSSGLYRRSEMSLTLRRHFRCGYVQGYYDVCGGSCGTAPLFPPKCYWGAAYQTAHGTQCIHAWFSGYQDGAVAALSDGALGSNRLPTSWAPPPGLPHPSAIAPESSIPGADTSTQGPWEEIPAPPVTSAPSPVEALPGSGAKSSRRPPGQAGAGPAPADDPKMQPALPANDNSPPKSGRNTTVDGPLPGTDDFPRIPSPAARNSSFVPLKEPVALRPVPRAEDSDQDSEIAQRAFYSGDADRFVATAAQSEIHADVQDKSSNRRLLLLLFNMPPLPDDDPPTPSVVPLIGPPPPP